MEFMSDTICYESMKLLRQIYCCARDQSILNAMDLLSEYPFLSVVVPIYGNLIVDDSMVVRPSSVNLGNTNCKSIRKVNIGCLLYIGSTKGNKEVARHSCS